MSFINYKKKKHDERCFNCGRFVHAARTYNNYNFAGGYNCCPRCHAKIVELIKSKGERE